jgi:4-aminobutyrate aminotransferase-like enzyme
MRMAYAHNDANDYNLLVKGDQVTGLIDFGDMVHTQLINNVAVACVYAMLSSDDPLQTAAILVKGYHSRYPLQEKEVDLLYYLIAARLCISVTRSAFQASLQSDNEHHFVTERPAWKLLHTLITINPLAARQAFRQACGLPSVIGPEKEHERLEQERRQYVGRNLSISYQQHLKIEKGALQYLYDDRGRTFIDCVNNVSHVGHCHPTVVKAMQGQIARLNTNTRYLHDGLVDFARKLTATLPSALKVCYFTNSGSEANDLAIRMSRHFTGRQDVIVLDHAYHGTSTVAIEMSPYKFDGKGGAGKKPYIHKALNPDMYRGPYKYGDPDAGRKYAEDVRRIIGAVQPGVAAFICETLLGVGGQIPLPPGYLEAVYGHVRDAGGLCIADEVQVGFGRVGETFWGFELQGVVPDIVVLGKPIGNGHPLAAVVVTEAIANAFNNGMEYFNTFGGNPVSMATGLSVLQVIQEEGLQQHAKEVGDHLLNGLRGLMTRHAIIGDVRGSGLFVGAELVKDRQTLEPALPEIDIVVEKMKDRGFLISTDGPLHNVLKIKPPLVFSKENADALVWHLDEVLGELKR